MSKSEKLLAKFSAARGQFKWSDLVSLFSNLGFQQIEGEGSRVSFVKGDLTIRLHKPHPQKEVKVYAVKQIQSILKDEGLI